MYLGVLLIFFSMWGQSEPIDQTLEYAKKHQSFKELDFKQHEEQFVELVKKGQNPHTLFIGCSDSRVLPDLILRSKPGELFTIRTAGNFVPPYDIKSQDGVGASIQYALEVLNIKHIIVCGHSHCGAIRGLFDKLDNTKFNLVQQWLKFGEPAKKMALETTKKDVPREELYEVTEQLSIIFQLENLLSYPFVKSRVEKGQLELHGWYYTIENGEIEFYDWNEYKFKPLKSALKEGKGT